jgi:polyribonucleotide nucleotidyltransferase
MSQLKESKLNLVVAGTEQGVMIPVRGARFAEDVMLGGVVHGHEQMQAAIQAIHEPASGGKPAWEWQAPGKNDSLIAPRQLAEGHARGLPDQQKQVRNTRLQEI